MEPAHGVQRVQSTRVVHKREGHCNLGCLISLASFFCVFLCAYMTYGCLPCTTIKNSSTLSPPFRPRCVFLVVNAIIAFLVGESRLKNSPKTRQINKIDHKYTNRTQNFIEYDLGFIGKTNHLENSTPEKITEPAEDCQEVPDSEQEGDRERGLPVEELNKRADEFIARFNRQMRLESR